MRQRQKIICYKYCMIFCTVNSITQLFSISILNPFMLRSVTRTIIGIIIIDNAKEPAQTGKRTYYQNNDDNPTTPRTIEESPVNTSLKI